MVHQAEQRVCIFYEDTSFRLKPEQPLKICLNTVSSDHQRVLLNLNLILCSDIYLLQLNQTYLNHNTFTDVITFDYSENYGSIRGDIFISVERVGANSLAFKRPFKEELYRVAIHGLLHLLGYQDYKPSQKKLMRALENKILLTANSLKLYPLSKRTKNTNNLL